MEHWNSRAKTYKYWIFLCSMLSGTGRTAPWNACSNRCLVTPASRVHPSKWWNPLEFQSFTNLPCQNSSQRPEALNRWEGIHLCLWGEDAELPWRGNQSLSQLCHSDRHTKNQLNSCEQPTNQHKNLSKLLILKGFRWRVRWDSNSRWISPRRFSRPVHSTALPQTHAGANHITGKPNITRAEQSGIIETFV